LSAVATSTLGATRDLPEARPVGRAALWLACLGPFFYVTYGTANWLASLKAHVPALVYDWERQVPFLGWTILPYWSTNAFYAASLFVCATRRELDTHGRRLLTAQIVAVSCFIAFPLRFSWPKPETSGLFGFLFEALGAFDKPFNQAPSLHVALTVILWSLYSRHLPRLALPLFTAWSALVVASVMTTYQHHFVDIPTGALLGLLCIWAWPDRGASPLAQARLTRDRDRRKLALCYGAGASILASSVLAGVSAGVDPAWLWMLWPAFALAMVGLAYAAIGPALFQKYPDGHASLAARILTAPYRLGAFLNSRLWTRRDAKPALIADGVSLGRFPTGADLREAGLRSVVDLTSEFAAPRFGGSWRCVAMLDLVAPPAPRLVEAAEAIERARPNGPVLVCCALGYGRSAAAAATWLLRTRRCASLEDAVSRLRAARPRLALSAAQKAAIEEAAREP
jgi:protein-tyrosine phosphatase